MKVCIIFCVCELFMHISTYAIARHCRHERPISPCLRSDSFRSVRHMSMYVCPCLCMRVYVFVSVSMYMYGSLRLCLCVYACVSMSVCLMARINRHCVYD